jgi:hypothetical protein
MQLSMMDSLSLNCRCSAGLASYDRVPNINRAGLVLAIDRQTGITHGV